MPCGLSASPIRSSSASVTAITAVGNVSPEPDNAIPLVAEPHLPLAHGEQLVVHPLDRRALGGMDERERALHPPQNIGDRIVMGARLVHRLLTATSSQIRTPGISSTPLRTCAAMALSIASRTFVFLET